VDKKLDLKNFILFMKIKSNKEHLEGQNYG
jgi:hypothetical protein